MLTPSMPGIADTMYVYGVTSSFFPNSSDGTYMGITYAYDKNGNRVGLNDDWYKIRIYINIDDKAQSQYNKSGNALQSAKKVFTHEVGHALKLAHPDYNTAHSGHTINNHPYAVMNQALPGQFSYVAASPTSHDKQCLAAKWRT